MSRASESESILVVDDSSPTTEVVQRNLAGRGFRVYTASNASEAMQVLESTPIDLVITDLKMPGPSGLDLIRHVRQNWADTEVMILTGYATV
jgi:two-component system response regulator HydG